MATDAVGAVDDEDEDGLDDGDRLETDDGRH